jgi:hypothetical protein
MFRNDRGEYGFSGRAFLPAGEADETFQLFFRRQVLAVPVDLLPCVPDLSGAVPRLPLFLKQLEFVLDGHRISLLSGSASYHKGIAAVFPDVGTKSQHFFSHEKKLKEMLQA